MKEKLEKWDEQQIILSINNGKLRLKLEKIEKEFPSILTYQETLDKIILEKIYNSFWRVKSFIRKRNWISKKQFKIKEKIKRNFKK